MRRRDLIDANPAQFVEKPAAKCSRDRVLDDGELVEVWRAVDGMSAPFAAGVRLLVLTAARRSEIFEATHDELKGEALHPPARRAKAEGGRMLPLSAPALALIEALPRLWWPGEGLGLAADQRRPAPLQQLQLSARPTWTGASWQARKKVVGDDAKPMPAWRLHDLRRSVATGMQRLGVRLEVIEAALGHVRGSRAGIVGVYQRHAFEKEAAEALALWGDHMMRLLDPKPAKVLPMRRAGR